jgi:hypothetical protein
MQTQEEVFGETLNTAGETSALREAATSDMECDLFFWSLFSRA